MKLLFVCQHYFPERINIGTVCEELVKQGHDVTALVGLPNYHMKDNKVPKEYHGKLHRKETINGVKVIRCTEFGRRNNFISLMLNYYSFWLSSKKMIKNLDKDFDRVICYQYSPITMAGAAAKYAKMNHCPLVLYCFDLWPESVKTYNIKETNPIFKIAKKISKEIYTSCDKIIVSSKPFIQYFEEYHNIPNKKIVYLPQYSIDYGKKLKNVKKDGKIHLLYAGNVGKMQNVECIIDAVKYIKTEKDYVIDIVGNGSDCLRLINLVNRKKLNEKIIFHGEKNEDELLDFYSRADALLLTMKDNGTYISKTLPLKLQSYMSTGKPVLASINGAAEEVINEYKCGYCVPAGDTKAFATIIQTFIEKHPKLSYKTDKKFFLEENTKELFKIIEETK